MSLPPINEGGMAGRGRPIRVSNTGSSGVAAPAVDRPGTPMVRTMVHDSLQGSERQMCTARLSNLAPLAILHQADPRLNSNASRGNRIFGEVETARMQVDRETASMASLLTTPRDRLANQRGPDYGYTFTTGMRNQ